ncbi:FAD binding domain-containing protein [Miniphocaeibacter halophilus]|uniref:FAD binding domain-containing protein n=1 Tax=Miniphocaeibacter halophilus TaxID=2931922 RepID=A0AC61MY10_9FIRM|nr:FAD binding domain-containing protein [Miniphocaeibacter halophilus]QQK08178.1 FAD binding domain-containing protein [Miniphocaeibacter halophilus]
MVKNYTPKSLDEALELMKNNELVPFAGGTDLMVKNDESLNYIYLYKIPELKKVYKEDSYLKLGAASTFTELIENKLIPEILRDALKKIAAPAIRNFGTIGGNIGNGSSKADSVLIFMVLDAYIKVQSKNNERVIPIKDFYKGNKKLDLNKDELITEIWLPEKEYTNYVYEKVGARQALAISRVDFAGIIDIEDNIIKHIAVAIGAIEDLIIRRPDIDNLLIGKTIEEAKSLKEEYLNKYSEAINPRAGRVSVEYRKDVSMNFLNYFLESKGI